MEQKKHVENLFSYQLFGKSVCLVIVYLEQKLLCKFYMNPNITECVISGQHISCYLFDVTYNV